MTTNSGTKPVSSEREIERIRTIYGDRDRRGSLDLYAWHLPHVQYQWAMRARLIAVVLQRTLGQDISRVRALDVGCGTGGFLRRLIDWGAVPTNLVGTEFLADRLARAGQATATGVQWRLGGLDFDADGGFDLVSAHTVFSSILDGQTRSELANDMWRMVRPGGWVLVFDFRYNNPTNPDVRRVTRKELEKWWPARERIWRTGLLVPPFARRLVGRSYALAEVLTSVFPFLRSHFVYMAQK